MTLHFSEPVRPESVVFAITPPVQGVLHWAIGGQSAKFWHDPLTVGATYTFTVVNALDLAGNALPSPVQQTFTIADTDFLYLPLVASEAP
jgi:hypothetical protein